MLGFFESTYRAGDFRAGGASRHACVNGATDPYASRGPPLHMSSPADHITNESAALDSQTGLWLLLLPA